MDRLCSLILVALLLPIVQGCVPVVAGGVGAGVTMANDRRTSGIFIEDEGIELKANSRISETLKDQAHINVTSFNLSVLMTGEAATAALRSQAENIVKGVPSVRQVFNEVKVAPSSNFGSRSNDGYLTTKIKARMIDARKFNIVHVKVVTEAGAVYLMGVVTRQEAEDATEITRTTSGVTKVVRLFEYLN